MVNIMLKNFLLMLSFLIFVTGCATKTPVTWQERIVEPKVKIVPLVYEEYGEDNQETLLFLHGFGESRHTWRFLVPELSKKYHLIMLDLKGFGDSPKEDDSFYSVYDQAKIVQSFIKHKRLSKLTLVGRSFGGGVSLVLALMQKDRLIKPVIERLILINAMAYKQELPSMLKTLNQPVIGFLAIHIMSNEWMAEEGYRYAFYNDDLIPKKSIEYTAESLALPLAKYAYLETVDQLIPDDIEKMQRRYREILLPSLIMWGKEDVSLRVSKAYRLHRDLKNSRLKVFPKVGHIPQEEVPSKVVTEIVKFMEERL